jgi:hypothetical protein
MKDPKEEEEEARKDIICTKICVFKKFHIKPETAFIA